VAALPTLDDRPADEILYDEWPAEVIEAVPGKQMRGGVRVDAAPPCI
jgi:hypothetical protein